MLFNLICNIFNVLEVINCVKFLDRIREGYYEN